MHGRRRFLTSVTAGAAAAPITYLAGCAPPVTPTPDASDPCPMPRVPPPVALDFPPPGYFQQISSDLDAASIGTPVVLIDLDRLEANVDTIRDAIRPHTFRIVEKSLPSLDLLRRVAERGMTSSFLVLHLPFLADLLAAFPTADVLMGKVHRPNAVRRFFSMLDDDAARADAAARVTFLAGSLEDLDAFAALAPAGGRIKVAIEIDVGLRRSGVRTPAELEPLLRRLQGEGALELQGLLGYDGQVAFTPQATIEGVMSAFDDATAEFQAFVDALVAFDPTLLPAEPVFHSGGTSTFPLYAQAGAATPVNDVATGGGVLRPGEYPDHLISDLSPAIFVAAPVLKQYDAPELPFFAADVGRRLLGDRQGLLLYGGGWPSNWVYPEGIGGVPLISDPSATPPLVPNQGLAVAPAELEIGPGDWVYFHPKSSDVLFQFEEVLLVRGGMLTGERLTPYPRRY